MDYVQTNPTLDRALVEILAERLRANQSVDEVKKAASEAFQDMDASSKAEHMSAALALAKR